MTTQRSLMRVVILAGAIAVCVAPRFITAAPLHFAAPEIIIFHGGPLAKPVVIASWGENSTLLLSGEPREPVSSAHRPASARPVIKLALFWGRAWRQYVEAPDRLATLTPAQANQEGVYFPAVPGARAMIRVGSTNGFVSDSGLAVLRRHGIPTLLQ